MRSFIFMDIVMPLSAKTCALLDLDFGAGLLELGLDRVGLVLGDALLDRLRRRVDEVLGLLEAETGDRADDLDHLDLLLAGAGEDDVERRLLLGLGRSSATGGGHGDRSGGGDAPLLLDLLLQLDELEDGHLAQALENGVYTSHYSLSSSVSSVTVGSSSATGVSSVASFSSAAVTSAATAVAVACVAPSPPSCSIRASRRPYRFCSGAVTSPKRALAGATIAPSTWTRRISVGDRKSVV